MCASPAVLFRFLREQISRDRINIYWPDIVYMTVEVTIRYFENSHDDRTEETETISGVTRIEEDCGKGENRHTREGYHELKVWEGDDLTIYGKGEIVDLTAE